MCKKADAIRCYHSYGHKSLVSSLNLVLDPEHKQEFTDVTSQTLLLSAAQSSQSSEPHQQSTEVDSVNVLIHKQAAQLEKQGEL